MAKRAAIFLFVGLWGNYAAAGHVELGRDRLIVDGKVAPYLFGAEVQYFRARGGSGRNVPAAEVEKLWNKMLDRVKEAKMNSVTFYIPWDFHEPQEGVFDFDGTLDQDGDGKPDYPSRNLKLFLKLVEAHGIRYVMIRPGPYINAEWGPEGFGAVPKWFLDKYPEALTVTQTPGKPRTVSFQSPVFREKVDHWFRTLYHQVLQNQIGSGKAIVFLQIDNETNYFWDSIYERDWSETALARYRAFLKGLYHGNISELNSAYGSQVANFEGVQGPRSAGDVSYPQGKWHYDWFQFHDEEIREYYRFLKTEWNGIGIKEPDVIFTSCDSYNAFANGLLPRLDYRNDNQFSLTTMNIYSKTSGSQAVSTLNNPMKAAHDALLMGAAHRQYYGTAGDWLMSTETMGGWFPPTEVSLASRQHTYGSMIATGVKAINIYYFHEGWNWNGKEENDSELHFAAPLDKDMNPTPSFGLLKELGTALESGLGELASATQTRPSQILIAHDSGAQYPGATASRVIEKSSTDSASLFGLLREAGYSAELAFIDRMTTEEVNRHRVIFWDHPGYLTTITQTRFREFLASGGTLVTFGNTGIKPGAGEKLIVLEKNPALGWNEDSYLTLPHISQTIAQIQQGMTTAVLAPDVVLATQDGKPYLHVWTRPTSQGTLVAVENFLPTPRTFQLKLSQFSKDKSYRWHRVFGLSAPALDFEITGEIISKQGTPFSVGKDSIELWSVQEK